MANETATENTTLQDPFQARSTIEVAGESFDIYRLSRLEELGLVRIETLPYSIRVLLESVLRNCDGFTVTEDDVKNLAAWNADDVAKIEIPFNPARVVLQDFTGVPAVVDLAAMRSAMQRMGGDPEKINPLVPVDLVIDHSVQVDRFGSADALAKNVEIEFGRNKERYEFLRWGQQAFRNFRVIPPNVGIVHQVNLEYLAHGVITQQQGDSKVAYPDTLVGTDSHTTMINGLGIVGWGVGGIEAEAVMLGQPLYMLMPEVVGFELTGKLPPGATATDLVLTCTEILRGEGVVGKFVEFYGSGAASMSLADRATLSNMAPEYGATMGFFPIDEQSIDYLKRTGRDAAQLTLIEAYTKKQQLFRTADAPVPNYCRTLALDLSTIVPSLAGPKRPQDRVALSDMKDAFGKVLRTPISQRGFELDDVAINKTVAVVDNGQSTEIGHGVVVIAAITSCTNTSNPSVMVAAGLVARNAAKRGLKSKPYVKTSLAPGSRVVTEYLKKSGLLESLEAVGFFTVGYGCTTCIGNSGPLPDPVANAIHEGNLVASAVISGNRNFEGRVNPLVKANYLASPPLVVAYALAGRTDIDLTKEPVGVDSDGENVMLEDLWPTHEEIQQVIENSLDATMFREQYSEAVTGNERWNNIAITGGNLYDWSSQSTYIQEPPFLVDLPREPSRIAPIRGARVLALLGDSITTDHISPAGAIPKDGPAGKYLLEQNVEPVEFNSFGSRRGNDRVMTRGTLANIRIRNQLAPGTEGGVTRHLPDGESMSIYDAALQYKQEGVPLILLAGAEYGTGSSRDWAAKGTFLLGVRAVLATSYERIHRSNLVGMGVLPLQFAEGQTWKTLGLTGEEVFDFEQLGDDLEPRGTLTVKATSADGKTRKIDVTVRIDTPVELEYYRNGGILQTVLRKLL